MPQVKFLNNKGVEETREIISQEQLGGFEKAGFKILSNPFTPTPTATVPTASPTAPTSPTSTPNYYGLTNVTPAEQELLKSGSTKEQIEARRRAVAEGGQLNDALFQGGTSGESSTPTGGTSFGYSDLDAAYKEYFGAPLFNSSAKYTTDLDELDKLRQNIGVVSPERRYEMQGEARREADAKFEPLIGEAQESKRLGMPTATVRAGQNGGFESTQIAGSAAVAPNAANNWVGAGGKLEEVQGVYDRNISNLKAQKEQYYQASYSALIKAEKEGSEDAFNAAVELYDRAQKAKNDEISLANEKIQALSNLENISSSRLKREEGEKKLFDDNLDTFASGLLNFDPETGEVTMPDLDTITSVAEQLEIDPGRLLSSLRNKSLELSKLSSEEVKSRLEIDKLQRDFIPEAYQEFNYAKESGQIGKDVDFFDYLAKKKSASDTEPSSYQEWKLAGGEDGTGKTYARFLAEGKGVDGKITTQIDSLAKNFDTNAVTKRFAVIQEGYNFANSLSSTTKNPADQQAIIYAFAKAMDPESVVREGEYATVQKYAQSWADTFGFDAKRMFSNSPFLTEEAMNNMKTTIESKYRSAEQSYDNLYDETIRRINGKTGQVDGSDYLNQYKLKPEITAEKAVDDFYTKNPGQQSYIDRLTEEGRSDEDISQILGLDYSQERGGAEVEVSEKIVSGFKPGSWGGQCGEFTHKIVDIPSMGDMYSEKQKSVDKHGFKKEEWDPEVGDVVISDASDVARNRAAQPYGHAAVVTKKVPQFVDPKTGRMVYKLTYIESNVKGKEKVSIGRTILSNDPAIYGALRGKIKQKFLT